MLFNLMYGNEKIVMIFICGGVITVQWHFEPLNKTKMVMQKSRDKHTSTGGPTKILP